MPDAAMTLAVAALYADGVTTIRDVASWRHGLPLVHISLQPGSFLKLKPSNVCLRKCLR
jgi:hypothetical protein